MLLLFFGKERKARMEFGSLPNNWHVIAIYREAYATVAVFKFFASSPDANSQLWIF